jgi:septal ring factor EnvC (AmiA/AmiB activator)
MDAETMVKDFTDQLKEQKATIVELEKQLTTRKDQVLRLEGAIEALNMTLKKPEEGIPDAPTTE